MVTEFETQFFSLQIEKNRLAVLAREVQALVTELTSPRDFKNESSQRAGRRAMVEKFCNSWGVTNIWVNDLVNRYEEIIDAGLSQKILAWLNETAGENVIIDVPEPRAKANDYPATKLV